MHKHKGFVKKQSDIIKIEYEFKFNNEIVSIALNKLIFDAAKM